MHETIGEILGQLGWVSGLDRASSDALGSNPLIISSNTAALLRCLGARSTFGFGFTRGWVNEEISSVIIQLAKENGVAFRPLSQMWSKMEKLA